MSKDWPREYFDYDVYAVYYDGQREGYYTRDYYTDEYIDPLPDHYSDYYIDDFGREDEAEIDGLIEYRRQEFHQEWDGYLEDMNGCYEMADWEPELPLLHGTLIR